MEKDEKNPGLIAFVGVPRPDGSVTAVRVTEDQVEVGFVSPAKEGAPIRSELIQVSPSSGGPWHKVETLYDGRADPGRPAMVNSRSYRSGWDTIFGGDKSALN